MAAATTIADHAHHRIDPAAAVEMLLDANARTLARFAFEDGARKDTEAYLALRRLGFSPNDVAIHFDRVIDALGDLRSCQ